MAGPTDFNEVLQRVGFNADAVGYLTHFNGKDLSLDSLPEFENDDIDNLIRTLKKTPVTAPGVTTAAPVAGAPMTYLTVSTRAHDRMKMACFIARHFYKTQRTQAHAFYMSANILAWKAYRKGAEEYSDPTDMPTLVKANDPPIINFIEC